MAKRGRWLRQIISVTMCISMLAGCGNSGSSREEEKDNAASQSETGTQNESAGTERNAAEVQNGAESEQGNDASSRYDHKSVFGTPGEVAAYDTAKANYELSIDAGNPVHEISDLLYGVFIEDINFAADGGLYAEMVQNRSFEFTNLAKGNEMHAWSDVGSITANVIKDDKEGALNENNPNYLLLENAGKEPAGIANRGFLDGMAVTSGAGYDFSIYARGVEGYTGPIHVAITAGGETVAEGEIASVTDKWEKYELELVSAADATKNVKLQLTIDKGKAAVDMVSLFPQDTFLDGKGGLKVRKDLAEKIAELEPAFLRFPGGCVVEGVTLDKAYDWKDSIGVGADGEMLEFQGTVGDVAARKMGQNIWTNERATNDENPSYMTYGMGFYEYFLLAEDIGAVGVPVLNCGMSCMAQGNGSGPALNSEEFEAYVRDALDLVEFCRGDGSTKWGAVRVAMGHEEPFALKYIGIGNENWGDNFFRHYQAFVDAFDAAKKENPKLYGDIGLIFTAGPDDGDSGHSMYMNAYTYAENWLKGNPDKDMDTFAGVIDHHYYNTPDWFLSHTDYYDAENYTRTAEGMTAAAYGGGIPVFLGEYAAQANNLKAALAEAAYMTGLERNGDIVVMAAYAPLFGNLTATHWAPDLIWFNHNQVTCSVNYYVQKIFSLNAGTAVYDSALYGAEISEEAVLSGKVGVGTWNTAAKFDNVKIVDNVTGEVLSQDDFSQDSLKDWQQVSDGKWEIQDGELIQSSDSTNTAAFSTTGTAAYFGDTEWTDYTYTVEATKTAGAEGFLIPFAVGDKNNHFFWNIGGWNNTVSCLQQVKDGVKSDQVSGTTKPCVIRTGQKVELKIEVQGSHVNCYIDGKQYIDYDLAQTAQSESYQVVSTDESGDIIIKLVNETNAVKTYAIAIENAGTLSEDADVDLVAGKSLLDDNILGKEEVVTMKSRKVSGVSDRFNYTADPYSVTVLRLHRESGK